jgi:hypothetical protein
MRQRRRRSWGGLLHRFPFRVAAANPQPDQPLESGKHLYSTTYPWLVIVLSVEVDCLMKQLTLGGVLAELMFKLLLG